MTRWACCLALLLSAAPDAAQPPDKPIRLTLRPAPAPAPALKYRLLPELSEMKPGNAALLYQRAHSFEWWTNVRRLPYYHDIHDWLDWPPEKFPRDKVDFVRRFGALLEVDRAARRYHCDWEMTQRIPEEGIGMLLPDVQGFREYAMLLAVRCRLEIADGQYDKAIYTLQTGIALGRHVNEAPITINALVGNAIITVMLHEAERLLQAPDAPNLYWALTTLPRPLIDLRRALEGEKMMLEAEFPVLKTIETQPLSPHDQQQTLKKLNDPLYMGLLRGEGSKERIQGLGFLRTALETYPHAKRALIASGRKAEEVEKMPVLQVILIEALRQYRHYRDEAYKWMYVPYPEAAEGLAKFNAEVRRGMREQPARLFLPFLPFLPKAQEASVRLDRQIAALRCIEAVRLHAAANNGKLPEKLSDIKMVPVPADPATGRAFVYQVQGDRVTLRDPPRPNGRPALPSPLHYEITLKR